MGCQKQRWTVHEEEALRAGVKKHGTGKWKVILTDPEFTEFLDGRSNIDLKDKWRNMCSSVTPSDSGAGRRGRSPNLNMGPPASPPNSLSELHLLDGADLSLSGNASGRRKRVRSHKLGLKISPPSTPNPISIVSLLEDDGGTDMSLRGNSSGSRKRGRLSKLKGLEIGSPSNSTADVSLSGNTSVSRRRDKVSKFKRFEIGQSSSSGNASGKRKRVRVPEPKALEIGSTSTSPNPLSDVTPSKNDCTAVLSKSPLHKTTALNNIPESHETLEDAARYNAYRISIAEDSFDVASKACAEAGRVSKLAEEAEAMLLIAQEILDKCEVDGSVYFRAF